MITIVRLAGDKDDEELALRDMCFLSVTPEDDEDDGSLELVLESSSKPHELERCFRDPRPLPLPFFLCSLLSFSFFLLCLSADVSAFRPRSSQSRMIDHTSATSSSPICTCISSAGCHGVYSSSGSSPCALR